MFDISDLMAEVETGLERLREVAAQFHTMFPAAECGWYGLEPGERRWRALQRLADTLLLASQQECLQYPATEWLNVKVNITSLIKISSNYKNDDWVD